MFNSLLIIIAVPQNIFFSICHKITDQNVVFLCNFICQLKRKWIRRKLNKLMKSSPCVFAKFTVQIIKLPHN